MGYNICVFAGSSNGAHADYLAYARALGREIGRRGYGLVTGGTNTGLMWALATVAKANGALVYGVIPEGRWTDSIDAGLKQRFLVADLAARKQQMMALASAFVAIPGGIGTLDELSEVMEWGHLGYHHKPVGILDVRGYFSRLQKWLAHAREEGFIGESELNLMVDTDPATLLERLAPYMQPLEQVELASEEAPA